MIETFLLRDDPESARRVLFHYDHATGEEHIETINNVDRILDETKAQFASTDERARWGEGQFVAEIPPVIWGQMLRDGRANDPKAIAKWVNDPDNRAFRYRPGRVG
jgi:hypothetical protein